jgi:type IX secretion system PorP/SprF family membrane protein
MLVAQTFHFSDAYLTHLVLNPANTGRFNGEWRAVGVYRQQGENNAQDYQTGFFSFEHPFYYKNERIDAGIYFLNDNSANGTLPVNRVNLSLGHGVRLGLRSMLYGGIQLAGIYKQVTWDGITFPDQYSRDTGGFDSTMPTGESFENSSTFYLDAGFGVVFIKQWDFGMASFGYSAQQLNRPRETFFDVDNNLSIKHVFHAKGDIVINERLFLIPSLVGIYVNKVSETMMGGHLGYNVNDWLNQKNNVIAGLHLRNVTRDDRSLVLSAGVSWQYWSCMITYDMDINSSTAAGYSSSALEFGAVFKLPSTDLTRKLVPCERY